MRDRRFRLLWSGQALSQFGDSITPLALTLAIIKETGSATDLGIVLAAMSLAQVVLFLPGGVWADRLPRRLVMLTAEIVRGGAQLFIGIELLVADHLDIAAIAAAAACTGAATAFFLPATTGLLPATVQPDHLQRANGLLAVTKRTSYVVGPTIATTLALTVGAGWALVIDAGTFWVSATTLALLRVRQTVKPRERFLRELGDGWRELRERRWYWTNLISHSAWNLGRCAYFVVGPLVAVSTLGGAVAWGTIVQGGTIGALVGALLSLRVRPRRPLIGANVCLAFGALPLLLLAVGARPILIAFAAAMMYSALGFTDVMWESTVQRHIPPDRISRIKAYDWLASVGLNPVGMALAGPLAVAVGNSATLYGAAVMVTVCTLGVLMVPDVRRLPAEPGSAEPGSAEPGSAEPGSAEPGMTAPDPAAPDPSGPDTAGPETLDPPGAFRDTPVATAAEAQSGSPPERQGGA